jgi:hypothetical protein
VNTAGTTNEQTFTVIAAAVADLKSAITGDDRLSVYGRLAVEWGLRFSTATREWAEWAEAELKASGQAG